MRVRRGRQPLTARPTKRCRVTDAAAGVAITSAVQFDSGHCHARHQMDPRQRRRVRPRRSIGAARLEDAVFRRELIAIDERRRAAIQAFEAGAGAAQRGLEGDRRSRKGQEGRGAAQTLMAEVAELKADIPELEAEEKAAEEELDKAARRDPEPAARRSARRQGRARQCRASPVSERSASTASRRSSISNWAKRSGMMDFETAAKLSGARFVVLKKGAGAAGARARAVHARSAYERARLHRNQSAVAGARRRDVRHGAIAEVCR